MLNSFFWILIGCMTALAAMQLLYIVWYQKILQSPSSPHVTPESRPANSGDAPEAAIVLCLRGPDPTLPACLTGLLNQRYPAFSLHLVVDSDDDPVVPITTETLQSLNSSIPIHWHTVTDHGRNRSLKCSALLTAVMAMESQKRPPKIIAFVDADALVDPDWLQRLATPLQDSHTIGATTGNRWFEPTVNNLGSQFRAAWNAAALPQMQIYRVAWGGSLALKLETIQRCDLLDRWSQAFCEDTMLAEVLQTHGLQVHRVPEQIVVNQESTTLKSALGWIGRQLLTVRLHHRAWPLILGHAIFGGFCFFAPLVLAMVTAIEDRPLAIWTMLVWIFQLGMNIGLLSYIRWLNINAIQKSAPQPINPSGLMNKIVVAIALQAIYPFLAIGAAFRQRTRWRGIDYRIGRDGEIEVLDYVPYSQVSQTDQHSIQ